ncbi:MAG: class I SAM-dependent methyltransferase [Deltaproteobacteria bacterium]|jgi:SAM-dependent methyltransferase|nr:class I SAM-dependent methyltransferase [Deltaproteobacteria bacterium]MCL5879560.1 class I SAM-dependent methyltransferase [Deltaproteobacteria bacterium]
MNKSIIKGVTDKLIFKLYHNKFLEKIFHTREALLKKDIKDCKSVLDLGCGSESPIKYCKNVEYSVGVEAFKPDLEKSKLLRIHSKYINENILNIDFEEDSFDAVMIMDVIEHLNKEDAIKMIKRADKWARKKIIITTPNGFYPAYGDHKNILQTHLSGFGCKELQNLGFTVYGINGLKILWVDEVNRDQQITIKDGFKIKPYIFGVSLIGLSQLFTYFLPNYAFTFYAVKNKDNYAKRPD